jgi:hypothetical protein
LKNIFDFLKTLNKKTCLPVFYRLPYFFQLTTNPATKQANNPKAQTIITPSVATAIFDSPFVSMVDATAKGMMNIRIRSNKYTTPIVFDFQPPTTKSPINENGAIQDTMDPANTLSFSLFILFVLFVKYFYSFCLNIIDIQLKNNIFIIKTIPKKQQGND